ncbi:TraR/DksA family transcriptional regulator [Candidatus Manganitrophus noduliformans]|uniref:Transcriptional regulator, TraR/DksA family protein n=1 Tax=Candidatus Manganitrophus noduliformans TaxID=2606439 RepID=A0A7X6DUU5_9BACT|nr:TraR/DksA C4-type zinc finger protein [Candidatus Manganitrophus noduliformans]NKE73816.1 transcriptional regulator, TraR/DksA family protein [Candidatus Manganitrophus noduliformans]
MKKKRSTRRQETLQQILHQTREKVVTDIEKQLGQELDPRRIDIAMDTGDWAAFELSEGIDQRLLEMRYKTYKEIADAFRRLEAGTYGVCERCGEEVPVERLKVEPFARYCVPCLTQIEALQEAEKETGKLYTL